MKAAVRIVTGLLGLMYLTSAYGLITAGEVGFIGYTAPDALAHWAVANLGARIMAIGAGMILAAVLGAPQLLALMLGVRLLADATDTLISATTPDLPGFVVPVLAVFVAIEAAALFVTLRDMRRNG